MKKCAILINVIMFLGVFVGCSEETKVFNDENIIFEVVDTQSNNDVITNTIKITNETDFEFDNLSLKVSFPLDEVDTNNNAERETLELTDDFKMTLNETKEFSIPHVLKGDISANELEIDFAGSVMKRNDSIPFEIGGTFSALVASP